MRTCVYTVIVCLAAAGCAAERPGPVASDHQGIAELRIDAASLASASVTRVTVETAGQMHDLVLNPVTGTFDAALFLPSGTQTLVGRAFSGDTLVGASNPVAVDVQPGVVRRVELRILDLTMDTPVFGPLFDSLTFPTTVNAGASATFTLSVVAPAHDPVTYQWTSDCADSTFTAPTAATTRWSRPTDGACRIDVIATSNGFAIEQNFLIIVFPEGTDNGAVNVSGSFITGPLLSFSLGLDRASCFQFQGEISNSSCPITAAAPSVFNLQLNAASWRLSTPGGFALSDDCGGRFGITFQASDFVQALWMPPTAGGPCILTGRGTNSDGVSSSQSFAVLTRPGTVPTTHPPQLFVSMTNCSFFTSQDPPQDCGQVAAGSRFDFQTSYSWQDGHPGTVTVTDDCGGGDFHSTDQSFLTRSWTTSGAAGTTCHLTVTGVNLEGTQATASAQYHLF